MASLLPCPFCGEEKISLNEPHPDGYRYGSINCPACLAVMPGEVSSQDELIHCWNTRSVESETLDMLWRWFEDERRAGAEGMRPERRDGLSSDDFKSMLDEHEAALVGEIERLQKRSELLERTEANQILRTRQERDAATSKVNDACDVIIQLMCLELGSADRAVAFLDTVPAHSFSYPLSSKHEAP